MSRRGTAIAVAVRGPRVGEEALCRGEEETEGEEDEEEWSVNEEIHKIAESVVRDAEKDPLRSEQVKNQ